MTLRSLTAFATLTLCCATVAATAEGTAPGACRATAAAIQPPAPYEVGQRYLLFLMSRDDGTYLVVSPEGRYQVKAGGRLDPVSEKDFSVTLRGVKVDSLIDDLAQVRGQRSQ
jgi:hypothetical protein